MTSRTPTRIALVTGAFSNSGRHIAQRLLADGWEVRTLTGHPERRTALDHAIQAFPLAFDRPDVLAQALRNVDTLFNSYWVRFDHRGMTYEMAVDHTRLLIEAASKAGVRKVVHLSIANASADSPFRYYRGKAAIERIVEESGLQRAILRPTVIFGPAGILVNNIAWFLRCFPVFLIPGDGRYRIQPVHVGDLAELAVREAAKTGSSALDAVGPETFAYEELVHLIASEIGCRARVVHVSRRLAIAAARALGLMTRDVVLTPEEVDGLMADLLHSHQPPTCPTSFRGWLAESKAALGKTYLSELRTHFDKENGNG